MDRKGCSCSCILLGVLTQSVLKACEAGNVEEAKTLSKGHGKLRDYGDGQAIYAFIRPCRRGDLETAKFLVATFGLDSDDARYIDDMALVDACRNYHFKTVKWLVDTFYKPDRGLRQSN